METYKTELQIKNDLENTLNQIKHTTGFCKSMVSVSDDNLIVSSEDMFYMFSTLNELANKAESLFYASEKISRQSMV